MSRPPRPHSASSTTGDQRGDPDALNYLPSEYQDLFDLQRTLAEDELELSPSDEEGDFLSTLMELSAVVGHILAVYQDRYAGEAFLSTASAQSSLVRHARRLAYVPDVGVSATGAVALTVKDGLEGTVAQGLALASAPRGTVKAQDFETLADLEVSADINEILPARATRSVTLSAGATSFAVQGTGHGLEALDIVALVAGTLWQAFTIQAVEEDGDRTIITTYEALSAALTVDNTAAQPPVLYARPSLEPRSFGYNADPAAFPPADLKASGSDEPDASTTTVAGEEGAWYSAFADGAAANSLNDIYLSEEVKERLEQTYLVRQGNDASDLEVLLVNAARTVNVAFYERKVVEYTAFSVTGTTTTTITSAPNFLDVDTHISGTVTAIELVDSADNVPTRAAQPFPARWLGGFELALALCETEENDEVMSSPVELDGEYPLLIPGRLLLFSNLGAVEGQDAGEIVQPVEVSRVEYDSDTDTSLLYWEATDGETVSWKLNDVVVYGNVAEISHGRTVDETLGSSDGVTAFQRFKLKQSPVTHLSDETGASPVITVRVNDVAWTRVTDFWDSGTTDRHYRLEIDEELVATVVFGDGKNGAVPAAGTKNVVATYRVGVGTDGNMGVGRVTRIKKAHPLLKSAYNFTGISGGAAAASADDIREQATRYIRTFDRAVSVQDYADLALLYPGVARASAEWDAERRGVVLVAATSTGEEPSDELLTYLDLRRDTTVPLRLVKAEAVDIYLTVSVVSDAAYLTELVKQAVRDALYGGYEDAPGLFTFAGRDLGQQAFLSEVYAAIEGVAGVVSASVTLFSFADDGLVYDVLQPEVYRWLSLAAEHLNITVTASES